MCEQDAPGVIEFARGLVVHEQPVVPINVGLAEVALSGLPVERVVLPHDRSQPKVVGDRSNAVLAIIRLILAEKK